MTQWMPQTSDNFRPAATIGEIATIGGFGRSRETRMPVEPELGPADDGREIERLGHLPRRRRDRVGAGSLPARCAGRAATADRSPSFSTSSAMRFMVATASTGYWPDADSADSMTASAPSKIAVATSETSARVGTGLVIIDSSICVATIDRLAGAAAGARHLLLHAGDFLQRHLDAEIAARHHQRVGEVENVVRAASPPAASRSWPSPRRARA